MNRILAAVTLVCLAPGLACAQGLDIKRFRPAYSIPPNSKHGPTRVDAKAAKLVQGDVLYAEYAIVGLKTDAKTGKVSYEITLELTDSKGVNKMRRVSPNEALPQLGGNEMPGEMFITIGESFPPGKYTITLSVTDKLAKQTVKVPYQFQVVPTQLAFVQVDGTALALPGDRAGIACSIIGFALNKDKYPNVDVTIRVLDTNGKPVATPVETSFPKDLPEGVDKKNPQFLPVVFIVAANRPGSFVFEVVAVDKNAKNAKIELRVPLVVLDIGATASSK